MNKLADNTLANYLNIGTIKDFWLNTIAPKYFNFDDYNNYQSGIFGYINEVMANSVEDALNAVNTARREFYPITAEYMSSLYKMATLQQIDIPQTTPATCKAALVIKQSEVIENSTFSNGIYTCVIDSCLKIFADNIPFMLDYPIVILTKKTPKGWSHTIHYDVTLKNSLNTGTTSRYIPYKVLRNSGVNYLILQINTIRQVEMTPIPNVIIKDSILDTTSLEIDYQGNLANFEVFYKANNSTPPVQLKKVLMNGTIPNDPFCYYEYIAQNKIRLTFPASTSFVPEFNSEVETQIYTSLGKDGNFERFDGELICTSDSEDYPYNSTMTIIGQTNGSSTGGKDQLLNDEFRNKIIRAYSTNKTITTSNDLQLYFDELSENLDDMKVLFRKRRDDAFIRLFGAYVLMKDTSENIIPSATLDFAFKKSEVIDVASVQNRIMLKPGTQFVYEEPKSSTNFRCKIKTASDLATYADATGQQFTFTNPFLIGINLQPSTVGFYLNSVNEVKPLEYTYVNDDTPTQFIANNLKIYRNAIAGSNYYKISLSLAPANSDTDPSTIYTENPFSSEDDGEGNYTDTNGIRAKKNGTVLSTNFVYDNIPYTAQNGTSTTSTSKYCYLKTIIQYDDGTTETIVSSNTLAEEDSLRTGYHMNFNPGERFLKNDILATKLVTDLGKLKLVLDISNLLYPGGMYIPFLIEELNGDGYTFVAYISTDDMIDTSANIEIVDGIYNSDGTPNNLVAIPMSEINLEIHAFFKNDDINFTHKYSNFSYLSGYTLTNTYATSDDEPVQLIESLNYIRSTLDFYDLSDETADEKDYGMIITECPLLGFDWASISANYTNFINRLKAVHQRLDDAYQDLENNFSIDMKFYNTYGKSRFYKVGLDNAQTPLNNIACNFRFGVRTSTLSNKEEFITKMRNYVKSYIENMDNATSISQDVYIMNMISDIKAEFSEIAYLIYYGFNIYDHVAQKIVGPENIQYLSNYIPEFINVKLAYDADGLPYPDVEVALLES